MNRRDFLTWSSLVAASCMPGVGCAKQSFAQKPTKRLRGLPFSGVRVSRSDDVVVPKGYRYQVLAPWGTPIGASGQNRDPSHFRTDASNSAQEQSEQMGMNHDGMQFFAINDSSEHGLLVLNHEFTDEGLLHLDGQQSWSLEKLKKSQAAHGVSVIEIKRLPGGNWQHVQDSRYAKRITANTPMQIDGPAAGHAWMRTPQDASGKQALGTFANCASGKTPWGTYLTCEENWDDYFQMQDAGVFENSMKRYGIKSKGSHYRWEQYDPRFKVGQDNLEHHRHGWVVEIDPYNKNVTPVKHTALGRFKHETATMSFDDKGRLVYYMGDDERFEYIYKYVSDDVYDPDAGKQPHLLTNGTLYVAKFHEDGSGKWLPLRFGELGLTKKNGFYSQAQVLINTRLAADQVGATPMDRPEWFAVHPHSGEVFCTLTNNKYRGKEDYVSTDAVNPDFKNPYGGILKFKDGLNQTFNWQHFVRAGNQLGEHQDLFANPDGITFDSKGRLWIQTDMSIKSLISAYGNNQLLVADTGTGEIKRFLTGPRGCEVTGVCFSPDEKALFVNIQHPGSLGFFSDPKFPQKLSSWPDHLPDGRPRAATVVVWREDGGVIGG